MLRWVINTMIASMIFFPTREFSLEPNRLGLAYEDVFCKTRDNVQIHGWFLSPKAGSSNLCLLFFHGNADNISIRLPKAKEWVDRGISVFLVDYRGYGKSGGEIKRGEDLYEDGKAAFDWVRQRGFHPSQIVLYGESLGGVPAIRLGSEEKCKAVILEAPFTSTKELAKKHYGLTPPDFMIKDFLFDNESEITKLKTPLLVVHGTADEIVPFEMGKRLFDQAPSPKEFFEIRNARHNDISEVGGIQFYEKPLQFVMSL